jgi:hypothetical protein
MFGIDFSHAIGWAQPLGFLLLVDVVLGSLAAAKGGTFKASWLYLFLTTKGVAYLVGLSLLVLGEIPIDFGDIPVPTEWFTGLGASFLAPLGISVVTSIGGNVNQLRTIGDKTPPTGANPDIGIIEDGAVPVEHDGTPPA